MKYKGTSSFSLKDKLEVPLYLLIYLLEKIEDWKEIRGGKKSVVGKRLYL